MRSQCAYLWKKSADRRWLDGHEKALQDQMKGALAVIERPGGHRLQLEVFCPSCRSAQILVTKFGGRIDTLPRDWQSRFAKTAQTKPLKIGKRLVVVGSKESARDIRAEKQTAEVLIIPAATAFGTGEHVTTAMCLRLLEEATRGWKHDWTMLDAGTGTGILGLAGRCLGARKVLAIDNDPRAIATAQENARSNGIRRVRFQLGDVLRQNRREKFDVIIANLFSELLICALPIWKTRLKKKGLLILSGLLREQESELMRTTRSNGFCVRKIKRHGKWIALLCSRSL